MSGGPQIAVIGKGAPDEDLAPLAEEVGRRLARAGATVVCGGLGGVMEAAARGASGAGGAVIGIVPGTDGAAANRHCTHIVVTGIGHARNLAVVASGAAVVAIGGEWGTLAEIGFARRLGRRVVALRSWTVNSSSPPAGELGIDVADSPRSAVELALKAAGVGSL